MSIVQILTYLGYIFIIAVYGWRTVKYIRLPVHLRWELYPQPGKGGDELNGSYLENIDWRAKPMPTHFFAKLGFILKDYLSFSQYYNNNRGYWFVLYPWHGGFYLVFLSHVLFFFGGLSLILGMPVSSQSSDILALCIYWLTVIVTVGGCAIGAIGCIGLFARRSVDKELHAYSGFVYYFNYVFFFAVFVSGLVSWALSDPTLSSMREFWKNMILLRYADLDPASAIHFALFSLFLIYMPFTRAMHYITKFIIFFKVRWDETANLSGSPIEKQLLKNMDYPVSWSAPHIKQGKKWSEQV